MNHSSLPVIPMYKGDETMLGQITYANPTKLYFGEGALKNLGPALQNVGKKILLVYGGGSIKKNGIYDSICKILKENNKDVLELPGVMANPTLAKLHDGIKLVNTHKIDFILAVGGGSVCDYAKALAASAYCKEDPWDKYFVKQLPVDNAVLPVGCVLTMVGTGSEMNAGSVITDHSTDMKIGRIFGEELMPKFAVLDPTFTYTVPQYQMIAGFFDIMSHIMEQYFSGTDDNTSDYLAEGLMRSLVHNSRIAVKNPKDYEARSNIMWTATWALNTLIGMGKEQDWEVHMIGHAVSAITNATHGMTLASVSLPYYHFIMDAGLPKFVRFAKNVWHIDPTGKTDEEIAKAGLDALKAWMSDIGLVMHLSELGATPENLDAIADGVILLENGYKHVTREDVVSILKASM